MIGAVYAFTLRHPYQASLDEKGDPLMARVLRASMLRVAWLIAAVLFAAPHMATAAPITFEFTSIVVSVEHAILGVQPGDPVVG
jgi:hypothetical protein